MKTLKLSSIFFIGTIVLSGCSPYKISGGNYTPVNIDSGSSSVVLTKGNSAQSQAIAMVNHPKNSSLFNIAGHKLIKINNSRDVIGFNSPYPKNSNHQKILKQNTKDFGSYRIEESTGYSTIDPNKPTIFTFRSYKGADNSINVIIYTGNKDYTHDQNEQTLEKHQKIFNEIVNVK